MTDSLLVAEATSESLPKVGRDLSLTSSKLQVWHWERRAIVYVRQSSPQQVRDNHQDFPPAFASSSEVSSSGGLVVNLRDPVVDCGSILLSGDNGLEPSPIALVDGAYVAFWDYVDPGQQQSSTLPVRLPRVELRWRLAARDDVERSPSCGAFGNACKPLFSQRHCSVKTAEITSNRTTGRTHGVRSSADRTDSPYVNRGRPVRLAGSPLTKAPRSMSSSSLRTGLVPVENAPKPESFSTSPCALRFPVLLSASDEQGTSRCGFPPS